ncbi:MAG: hypothetical protein AAB681_00250 [Patescibacteria group bacterium]
MKNLETLAIFSNGLTGEFGSFRIARNEFVKKQSDLKTKQMEIVESVVKELLKKITDDDVRHVFLTKTETEKSVVQELVELALNFETGKSQQASFCKSSYLFNGTGDKISALQLVEKLNQAGKKLPPVAEFHSHLQIGGICFALTLL